MKQLLPTILALFLTMPATSQYYLRGEVRDEKGHSLAGVKFTLFSKGSYPYFTGSSGGFGIPTPLKVDTLSFHLEGYERLTTPVNTSQYGTFTLKMTALKSNSTRLRLSSVTKNLVAEKIPSVAHMGESYSSTIENEFINTANYPETGFALHVDRASYSNIRRFLNIKSKPPVDAVRIEEMLNYFNFRTQHVNDQKETFTAQTHITSCPWNKTNQLLFINLQARKINLDKTPPANLVFLIDVSGSMDMPNRLPLLKSAFKLLVENLRSKDTVSIVAYGSNVSVMLQPTGGDNKQKIIEAVEGLTPAGTTPGESAIRVAYKLAKNTFIANGNNRVILATDGDFNVGQTSEKELEELISQQRKSNIYLTCIGVGMGNYKDSKLETLAKKGNGNFAYIDNEKEAEKVMVEEFAQTMYTVANDVYLNVTFNDKLVKSHRLIGFDNKENAIADSISQLEGGEVGSGHSLLSVFEITPVNNDTVANALSVASLHVSYKIPESKEPKQLLLNAPFNYASMEAAQPCLKFAASVVMFGTVLKQSKFAKDISWEDIEALASSSANAGNLLQLEFLQLVEKAKKIYPAKNKKKGNLRSLMAARS